MPTMKQDMVTLKGRDDVGHIPYQPFWLFIVRCFQLLLAIIILGLSAYAGSGYFFYAGYGIGIFSFVWTLLFLGYIQISTFFFPIAYNKYAHLVLECLSVIFWLSTFGSLAAVAAAWSIGTSTICAYGYCYKRDLAARYTYSYTGESSATKAAAALGAIEWALFIGSLIAFGIYLHRHRMAMMQGAGGAVSGQAVAEEHKMQPVVTQQHVDGGYHAQQPYPAQTPYPVQQMDTRYEQQTMA